MNRYNVLAVVSLLLTCTSSASATDRLAGRYEIATTQGGWQLTLTSDASGYNGELAANGTVIGSVSGQASIEEDGEFSVDGTILGQGIRAEFAFYENDPGDGFQLLLIPLTGNGVPDYGGAVEYPAQPVAAGLHEESDAPPDGTADTSRDARLVGFWTAQVSTTGAGGSLAAELYMEIREDGYIVDRGSRSMASFDGAGLDGGTLPGGEAALWQTDGSTIFISKDGANWATLARYEISGHRLLLAYYDGSRQLWYRR